jgi:glycine/D-amino acid oxidase-like deaminating enzyme
MPTAPALMDLKSGYPFWAISNGLLQAFPPLQADRRCDVAVVGGGITGALVADELARHGHDVVVVEQREIGWGSTAASTALLQYEIDTYLYELAERHGDEAAALAYRSCAEAIDLLADVARPLRDVGFARGDSLYYASRRRHRRDLEREYAARSAIGLPVELLSREALRERYQLDAPGAILSRLGARVDPYRMTYRLLTRLRRRGTGVFDRTRIARIETAPRSVVLHADTGARVHARHVVLAAGYAGQRWLSRKVAMNRSSYACVTDPIERSLLGPLARTLLWESQRPYLYLRSTAEGRLMIGGEDDPVDDPRKRDARVQRKAAKLVKRVRGLFPRLPIRAGFAWAGTFAETDDGLPFFGPHPQHGPRVHFAMAYGGNGITYAVLGAQLLRALVERRRHPLAALFAFERLDR